MSKFTNVSNSFSNIMDSVIENLLKIEYFFIEIDIIWHGNLPYSAKTFTDHICIIFLSLCFRHVENFDWPTTTKNPLINDWSQIHERYAFHIELDKKMSFKVLWLR